MSLQSDLFAECEKMAVTKGVEYANNDLDRLANFKEVGASLGISSIQVLMTYTLKHIRAIESYAKSHVIYSDELMRSRIIDIITYMSLLEGLIIDELASQSKELCETNKTQEEIAHTLRSQRTTKK